MAIETVEFDLSMIDQDTGRYMTARAYTVDGITNPDGSLRELSIGQLVMAICLDRASQLEASIIDLMNEMNATSGQLESLTAIEQEIVDFWSTTPTATIFDMEPGVVQKGYYQGVDWLSVLRPYDPDTNPNGEGVVAASVRWIRNDQVYSAADVLYPDFISAIEAKMDEKNSFSQQKMIELQSQTSKRDQTYDMISNILKSLNTVLVGNANNM